jgi:hypothetical protein
MKSDVPGFSDDERTEKGVSFHCRSQVQFGGVYYPSFFFGIISYFSKHLHLGHYPLMECSNNPLMMMYLRIYNHS